MRVAVPSLSDPRALGAVALAGACTGLVLGAMAALGARGAPAEPVGVLREAFVATAAPELRPRSTPSFSWALLLPRMPLRLATAGRELECLTDAVYYESRGEPVEGQEAVAQVVLNRTRKPGFPKSVCGVVFQRAGRACQFSFACNGSITSRREGGAWMRARRVAARALGGYELAEIEGATHFHVAGLRVDWNSGLAQVARIGAHVFYGMGRPHGMAVRAIAAPDLAPAVLPLPAGGAAAATPTPASATTSLSAPLAATPAA